MSLKTSQVLLTEILTLAELAERLKLSQKVARKRMDDLKVLPYFLGRGRGVGTRWVWSEVLAALESTRSKAKRPQIKRRPKPEPNIFTMSYKDAMAHLTQADKAS